MASPARCCRWTAATRSECEARPFGASVSPKFYTAVTTHWSIAPQVERPVWSSMSMRTRPPKRNQGVRRAPCIACSWPLASAVQPWMMAGSRLDPAPASITLPAVRRWVRAACAMKSGLVKNASAPAFGDPMLRTLTKDSKGGLALTPSLAAPNSLGVTATGDNQLGGSNYTKPKPVGNWLRVSARADQSFTSMIQLICRRVSVGLTSMGTASIIMATSYGSKSQTSAQPLLSSLSAVRSSSARHAKPSNKRGLQA